MTQSDGDTSRIDTLISICSRRPPPLSSHGTAWEDGARRGWEWAETEIKRLAEAGEKMQAERDRLNELIYSLQGDVKEWVTRAERAESTLSTLNKVAGEMMGVLGPMRSALQKQVDLLRFQARNSTAGLARTLIETAEGWQALCDNAEAAITHAQEAGIKEG